MVYPAMTAPTSGRPAGLAAVATPFAGLVAAHGVLSVLLVRISGHPFDPGMAGLLGMILGILLPWFLLALLIRRVLILAVVERSPRPIPDLLASLKHLARDRSRLLTGAFQMLLVSFFVGSFGYQKELVAVFQPFGWDVAFADLDRLLHFGQDPYRLLLPLFGAPLAVTALNAAYHAWFFLIYFVTFVACFAPRDHAASRAYLIAFVLTFALGGNLMAMAFSSAGPVYYERLGLGTDFAPLMAHLHTVAETNPVWALAVQEDLWTGYAADGRLAGISAMPSMHVATSVLMALYAFTHARWAGWVMTAFAVSILVGSVILGWHYAADGYAGALIALACWWVARRVA